MFHQYPLEDRLEARRVAARLDRLVRAAGELCARFVADHRAALALSFGKDSMAVLHAMHESGALKQCRVVMWNACGMDTSDTLAMRDYVVEMYGLNNYVETEPEAETLARTLALIDLDQKHPTRDFVYECLERPRWLAMDRYDINGTILGLRQDESHARRMTVATRGIEYWNKREKADILLPIARWTTRDVFLYSAHRNVPLHPIYHRAAALGRKREEIRLSSPVNVCVRTRGQIAELRTLYPETFARYAQAVPAIRTFA